MAVRNLSVWLWSVIAVFGAALAAQAAPPRLLIAASDYTTGRLDLLPLIDGAKVAPVMPIHSDAVTRAPEGSPFLFVVNRAGMDSVRLLDRETHRLVNEVPVGRGTNPQDVVPLSRDRAYVSRHESGELVLIDPLSTQGTVIARIPLGSYAAEKGVPQMAAMALSGDKLLVALQRLKRGFMPTDHSLVAVIDTRTNRVSETVRLRRTNPLTDFKRGPDGGWYLGCAGSTGVISKLDGAIERLDPVTFHSDRLVIEEDELGGDIIDFEILDADRGVAIVSSPNTRLVSFDVRTGRRKDTLIASNGYHLQQVLADTRGGKLYVADRDPRRPTVRVLNLATLREEAPHLLTLPAYQMTLIP